MNYLSFLEIHMEKKLIYVGFVYIYMGDVDVRVQFGSGARERDRENISSV